MGGAGPVPWSAIDAYAQRYGIDDLEGYERFCALIRAQDRTYLADVAEKLKWKGRAP